MADIVTVLHQDHVEVDGMLSKLEKGEGDEALKQRCLSELLAHADAESEIVYRRVREVLPDLEEDVADGQAEHDHMEQLIAELQGMAVEDAGFDGVAAALAGEVRHHVEEEEQEILPKYQEAVDQAELVEIAARFRTRKQQLLSTGARGGARTDAGMIDLTKEELYQEAKEKGLEGRSKMNKQELAEALGKA